ncbi:alkaline phosphatase D [Mariniphaga anaerophila]|uniref:Alkaline phosphatase D n=1 Tax=Mariniphaga anaerophila TaxID=1484053 RepID=A0A1M5FEE7_9BACT|nr:alkaline phosphatase D family protein [Mariniphaga anaerophila]SHF89920.1 alkaline phosphatase D [Mariniphaga anaerophila]
MKTSVLFVCFFSIALLYSCQNKKERGGPYFGNGFHNGCADHHSVVIWTRLTQNPEGNVAGQKFLVPDPDEHRELNREADSAKIWKAQIPEGFNLDEMDGACPGAQGEVRLTCYPLTNSEKKLVKDWTPVDPLKNFTLQWKLEDLSPGTKYVVEIEARAHKNSTVSDRIQGAFRTPPAAETEEDVGFCVVTCHDYWRRDTTGGHKIYDAMLKLFPDFYVHTGDIEYYDKPEPYALTEELMRFKWDRVFALPLQREFWGQVTSYFMKDDHDVLTDDAFPGMTYGTVSWERGLEIFDEQNPVCGKPYQTVRWGRDLQIWLTEGRVFRSENTDPDGPEKTIFGKEQKEWLFRTLEESDATFKVIINANPVLGPDRDSKSDNYSNSNFKYEGDEIREFLNSFDNVFLCNGDRHWQYVTHFEGTNLWEFSCGAGADMHAGGWRQEDVRPEHRFLRVKGGFLYGKVARENGKTTLVFQHRDVNGNVVHEEVFTR